MPSFTIIEHLDVIKNIFFCIIESFVYFTFNQFVFQTVKETFNTRIIPAITFTALLPVANTTCLAFGGEQMDELYITTAWFMMSDEDRKANPMAGNLFRIKTDVKGLPEPMFKAL